MRKEISPEKLKDMVESILPSKNREAARAAKARTNRKHRRVVRQDVCGDVTDADRRYTITQNSNVGWRRSGDKLAHFIRWCEKITSGMTTREALAFVQAILPKSLIGDHAYGHWETHRKGRNDDHQPWIEYWE